MSKIIYPDLSYKVTGVLFKVHNTLRKFCSEKQYGDLVEDEFKKLAIPYTREMKLPKLFDTEK